MPSARFHRYWSVVHDCKVVRASVFDGRGLEHFCTYVEDAPTGRERRAKRESVIELLARHAREGYEAGEVGLGELDEEEIAA